MEERICERDDPPLVHELPSASDAVIISAGLYTAPLVDGTVRPFVYQSSFVCR